ncbi:MAG: alpha/beta hydrolase [Phycisphaerae bacterium]|nr:alpha/beta hydrolase [Phycisphaerae bacterium]
MSLVPAGRVCYHVTLHQETGTVGESGSIAPQVLEGIWQVVSHNWALFSILLTLLLLIIVPVLILGRYVRICLNIIRDIVPEMFKTRVGCDPILGEERDFYATDGVRLRGTFMHPAATERRGLIIFAPEYKSDRHTSARYCRALLAAGYDVFSFDFRGHGDSAAEEGYTPRQWASDREVTDMEGAIAFAEHWLDEQGRPIELGLFGISRGACAAILASAESASVKAIVTDGVFSSDCTLELFMKRWARIFARVRVLYENHPPEFWRFLRWCVFLTCRFKLKCNYPSVRKTLTRMIPRPMLFIHGERDSFIPVEQSRLLYALSAQPKHLWTVPNAKHNQSVDARPAEYARRIVEFFDHYLAKRADPHNMYNEGRFEEIARPTSARRLEPVTVGGGNGDGHGHGDGDGSGTGRYPGSDRLRHAADAAAPGDAASNAASDN